MLYLIKKIFKFLPGNVPEFLYTTIFKAKPIKKVVNCILLFIIPDKILLSFGLVLFLNKKDPVVSGALALGVYENFETFLIEKEIHEGMMVIDIGANIGYYTVLFAHLVGSNGKVIAFEPDKQSGEVLKKNITANKFRNVLYVDKALSDRKGLVKLYISEENRGDNRIYDTKEGRDWVEVEMISLDDYLPKEKKVDIIKMDVQGAEALILKGMEKIISYSDKMIIFTEFWPDGIRKTGESPEEFLKKLVGFGFSLYNINTKENKLEKIGEINQFAKRYYNSKYTNIVCYKNEK